MRFFSMPKFLLHNNKYLALSCHLLWLFLKLSDLKDAGKSYAVNYFCSKGHNSAGGIQLSRPEGRHLEMNGLDFSVSSEYDLAGYYPAIFAPLKIAAADAMLKAALKIQNLAFAERLGLTHTKRNTQYGHCMKLQLSLDSLLQTYFRVIFHHVNLSFLLAAANSRRDNDWWPSLGHNIWPFSVGVMESFCPHWYTSGLAACGNNWRDFLMGSGHFMLSRPFV